MGQIRTKIKSSKSKKVQIITKKLYDYEIHTRNFKETHPDCYPVIS